VQHLPEPLVYGGVVGGLHSLLILAQELGTFLLRKTLKDHLWIARILLIDRLGGHLAESTPTI
jgi:hypothetical protein